MNVKFEIRAFRALIVAALCSTSIVADAGELIEASPAPGRDSGRIYYYVPDGIDKTKPAPLLIFLHGGGSSTPDTAPAKYLDSSKNLLMPEFAAAPFITAAPSAPPASDGSRWNRDGVSRFIDASIAAA